jgi:hypothetical protein
MEMNKRLRITNAEDKWRAFDPDSLGSSGVANRILVYVCPGKLSSGPQPAIIIFPRTGKVVGLSGVVRDIGNAAITFTLERCPSSDPSMTSWSYLVGATYQIAPPDKVFKYSGDGPAVQPGDYIRLNVINAGDEAADLTVQLEIEVV